MNCLRTFVVVVFIILTVDSAPCQDTSEAAEFQRFLREQQQKLLKLLQVKFYQH